MLEKTDKKQKIQINTFFPVFLVFPCFQNPTERVHSVVFLRTFGRDGPCVRPQAICPSGRTQGPSLRLTNRDKLFLDGNSLAIGNAKKSKFSFCISLVTLEEFAGFLYVSLNYFPITMACRSLTINESQRFELVNVLLHCCHRDIHFLGYVASCDIIISIYQFKYVCGCLRQPLRQLFRQPYRQPYRQLYG